MRVVGGTYRSLRLKSLSGQATRPTSDKVKESVFNILGEYCQSGACLDYYGGSGGLAIEAVSRGMNLAVICERNAAAVKVIRQNIQQLPTDDPFIVLRGPNAKSLKRWHEQSPTVTFDLVFLDPPYDQANFARDLAYLTELGVLHPQTVVVCEWDHPLTTIEGLDDWDMIRERRYGTVYISILQRKDVEGDQ